MVKRHELLQDELRKGSQNQNFKFTNSTYNTYIVGDNREGKWGNEVFDAFAKHPVLLRKHFEYISCGYHHNAALDENGIMYTWGRNNNGQLGQGIVHNQAIINQIARPLTFVEISEVSCGWQHTIAVTSFGFLYSWGLNTNGQLGLGDYEDRNTPTLVESVLSYTADKISAGYLHSAMIDDTGVALKIYPLILPAVRGYIFRKKDQHFLQNYTPIPPILHTPNLYTSHIPTHHPSYLNNFFTINYLIKSCSGTSLSLPGDPRMISGFSSIDYPIPASPQETHH